MKYSIDIKGIHCHGCLNLIKMSLEEIGLNNVVVDQIENSAIFETTESEEQIIPLLDQVFSQDLDAYKYSNLTIKD